VALKKKAKILVSESAVLMGVVDESGVLEENEVYVQVKRDNYSNDRNNKKSFEKSNELVELIQRIDQMEYIVESDVLVTRNPCQHPGDVRRLKCVNRPELAHLFNVIVFSSKGSRPK
jgi:hypothetical protein